MSLPSDSKVMSNLSQMTPNPEFLFSKEEYKVVECISHNTFSASQSFFIDTSVLSNEAINLAQSYIALPCSMHHDSYTGSGVEVAFKTTSAEIFSGIQIQSNGVNIVNNQGYHDFVVGVEKLLTSKDRDELTAFDKDHGDLQTNQALASADAGQTATTEFTATSATELKEEKYTTTTSVSRTANCNLGLVYRNNCVVRNLYTAFASNTYTWIQLIPLADLHDFVKHLDFNLLGSSLRFTFTLNQTNRIFYSSQLAPEFSISADCGFSRPRLYIRTNKLQPEILKSMSASLSKGEKRVIEFEDYELGVAETTTASTSMSETLHNGISNPTKVVLLMTSANNFSAGTYNYLKTYQAKLTSSNLLVNGNVLYPTPLDTKAMQYEELKKVFGMKDVPEHQKLFISFADFLQNYSIQCFDLRKITSTLASATSPVRLQLLATRDNSTSYTLLPIIYKKRMVELQLNGRVVSVIMLS